MPRLQETHFWWIYPRLKNNVFHVQCWISKASPNQMAIWLSQQREVRWNSVNHEKMSVSHSYWRHVKKIHISIVISSFIIIQKEERKEKYMFLWLTFFSQKCPLQNVSIQHIWCLLRKSSHFKRCLRLKGFFLYI